MDSVIQRGRKVFKTVQQESVLNLSERGKDFAVKDTMQLEKVFKDIKRESGKCFETFPNDWFSNLFNDGDARRTTDFNQFWFCISQIPCSSAYLALEIIIRRKREVRGYMFEFIYLCGIVLWILFANPEPVLLSLFVSWLVLYLVS